MTTLPISQIGAQLPTLLTKLGPGDEIVLVDGDKAVARVTSVEEPASPHKRQLGSAKGILKIIAEDDEHLEDFAEYM